MTTALDTTLKINELINRGALFVVNHSGGKDSQAMFLKLRDMVPASQLLVIHVDLPGADWMGTWDHVLATAKASQNLFGCAAKPSKFIGSNVIHPIFEDIKVIKTNAVKDFLEMVEASYQKLLRQIADPNHHRTEMVSPWPSPSMRQCTSDLKRGPIEREIRRYLKSHPRFNGLIVNCMGMRAEESAKRSKLDILKYSERNSKAGREWYDWLPIHDVLIGAVFATIKTAGQKAHWAYAAGMSRLSCMFCIMASVADLIISATHNPITYAIYVAMEKRYGYSMMMPEKGKAPKFLEEITGIKAVMVPLKLAA